MIESKEFASKAIRKQRGALEDSDFASVSIRSVSDSPDQEQDGRRVVRRQAGTPARSLCSSQARGCMHLPRQAAKGTSTEAVSSGEERLQ